MKRKYILAVLALIGLGVVTTMAFTLNPDGPVVVQSEVYEISDSGATGSITKVKAKPMGGSLDKVKIKITLSGQSVAYDLDIALIGSNLDLTGDIITGSAGSAGTHVLGLADNELIFTAIPSGSSWDVTIDAPSGDGYDGTGNSVWEDIDSLMITLSDN